MIRPYGSGKLARQYAGRMAVAAWQRPEELRRLLEEEGMEASHLCGNSVCFNPAHLRVEPRAENQSRDTCFQAGICRCGSVVRCIL